MDRQHLSIRIIFILFGSLLLVACQGSSSSGNSSQKLFNYLIQCDTLCADAEISIKDNGGVINKRYKNVGGLAVSIPYSAISALEKVASVKQLSKDIVVKSPSPTRFTQLAAPNKTITYTGIENLRSSPEFSSKTYLFNGVLNGAAQLHQEEITGSGIIVAVIDSGIANNPEVVPALSGSVLGGENFIELPDEPSATSTLNDAHGTMVSTMIAGHVGLTLENGSSKLLDAVLAYSPDSVIPVSDTESVIPVLGTAPQASLYSMKVFSVNEEGTPASIVLAAMDRALSLKKNFNQGKPSEPVAGSGSEDDPYVYDSLDIGVVNLSLGGPSMIPGLELEDIMVARMLDENIVVVTAAGNEGFAAMTTGSPSTSVAAISVGAATSATHERIAAEYVLGPGAGILFRPNDLTQVTYFSSRGPVADGRIGVDLVANGMDMLVQASNGGFALVSGTSFSAPTVAGAAALLRSAQPEANAAAIRSALIQSAQMDIFMGAELLPIDTGNGFLNVPAALQLLKTDNESEVPEIPDLGRRPTSVEQNIAKADIMTINLEEGPFRKDIMLKPGAVSHFFIPTSLNTKTLDIKVMNFENAPVEEQNSLYGDTAFLTLLDAPTSINDVLLEEHLIEDGMFSVAMPQSGILRLAIIADWVNADSISATVEISSSLIPELPKVVASGRLSDDESDIFEIEVSEEVSSLNFMLSWNGNWGRYPAHDLDLILLTPGGEAIFDGATLTSPERVQIPTPEPGEWKIIVTGFMLHGFEDRYELRITDQNNRTLEVDRDGDND